MCDKTFHIIKQSTSSSNASAAGGAAGVQLAAAEAASTATVAGTVGRHIDCGEREIARHHGPQPAMTAPDTALPVELPFCIDACDATFGELLKALSSCLRLLALLEFPPSGVGEPANAAKGDGAIDAPARPLPSDSPSSAPDEVEGAAERFQAEGILRDLLSVLETNLSAASVATVVTTTGCSGGVGSKVAGQVAEVAGQVASSGTIAGANKQRVGPTVARGLRQLLLKLMSPSASPAAAEAAVVPTGRDCAALAARCLVSGLPVLCGATGRTAEMARAKGAISANVHDDRGAGGAASGGNSAGGGVLALMQEALVDERCALLRELGSATRGSARTAAFVARALLLPHFDATSSTPSVRQIPKIPIALVSILSVQPLARRGCQRPAT